MDFNGLTKFVDIGFKPEKEHISPARNTGKVLPLISFLLYRNCLISIIPTWMCKSYKNAIFQKQIFLLLCSLCIYIFLHIHSSLKVNAGRSYIHMYDLIFHVKSDILKFHHKTESSMLPEERKMFCRKGKKAHLSSPALCPDAKVSSGIFSLGIDMPVFYMHNICTFWWKKKSSFWLIEEYNLQRFKGYVYTIEMDCLHREEICSVIRLSIQGYFWTCSRTEVQNP